MLIKYGGPDTFESPNKKPLEERIKELEHTGAELASQVIKAQTFDMKMINGENQALKKRVEKLESALQKIVHQEPEKHLSNNGWAYFHQFKKIAVEALKDGE